MKKTLTILCMSLMAMNLQAQGTTLQNNEQEDSTISVIGYFCKNDTMEYQRTQGKYKISGNDTIDTGSFTERFRVAVTDSTSEGYKMEITLLSSEIEGETNDFVIKTSQMLANELRNIPCRFTTDELGRVQHIENWREIRDVLKRSFTSVFDSLYSSMPGLDSIMPRKQMESLILLGCSTEDGIKDYYDELEMLFGMHGLEVTMEPDESDATSDSGFPMHISLMSFYSPKEDEYDEEGDYVIQAKTVTKMPIEDMTDLLSGTFGMFFSGEKSDSLSKYVALAMKESDGGITTTNREQYCYYYNGWPKISHKITEVNIGDIAKRIEYDLIEWYSRRWGVFTFPEIEEEGKKI